MIKQKTSIYESFHKSLPNLSKESGNALLQESRFYDDEYFNEAESYPINMKLVLEFERTVDSLKSIELIFHEFEKILRHNILYKEANLFVLRNKKLYPYLKNVSERTKLFVDKVLSTENLSQFIKTGTPKIFNDTLINYIDGTKYYYLVIPVFNENQSGKLLTILMPERKLVNNSNKIYLIQLCLQKILSKIDYLSKQDELDKSLKEIQTYQTKLANDFKLSAIGELTSGIIEEILSPLQVIISATEFLRNEVEHVDNEALDTISNQVKKVKGAINSLVKFAGNGNSSLKIQPCNLNELLSEFYSIINSSLKNDNYEGILDLEDNLPPILSQPNVIQQLFTNVYTLIRSGKIHGGGIFIQSRFKDEKVILRLLTTDYIEGLNSENIKNNHDVSLKIISNLMAKHEGEMFIDSNKSKGTIIILIFPIKRSIGK